MENVYITLSLPTKLPKAHKIKKKFCLKWQRVLGQRNFK